MTKTSLLVIAAAGLLAACGNSGDYNKTKSGLAYKIVKKGDGPQVKRGQFLKVSYTQKINDSTLQTSIGGMPAYVKADSIGPVYSPAEVFELLHKGDSVIVVQEVDTILKRNPMLPPFMKKGDKMKLYLKVVDVLENEDAVKANQAEEMKGQEARDLAVVEAYLQKNSIKAEKIGKGTYVVVTEPGTGATADSGKFVSVKYRGKLLTTGKEFESTMEAGKDPISFPLGQHAVIPGWDEGLTKFAKGGKGTLYIPGFLAYGMRPGPGGSQNEALMFDVEMVNISDSAPAPKQNPLIPPAASQPAHK
ncbi:FKBP-type peptidyl-prolyl cis-trans isomerase [Flavihumibacter petaseus]|uniref:Peptidyl-prolyl cis-trans isomerase n=1 Tax=Flavihumibacter petaseus NBRC 106054 TaxID=1220578 RepID=A0A0E9N6S0_9BACT|nr:FKBP-type peptidyl-prolyl cis-trans isomerase [Flavihumibacter petaseus]GAO45647.1 putative FKBP-type peptidyl-prolyl cis-trans isomerase [Flavihumibacter petaseus NBRC 106054]